MDDKTAKILEDAKRLNMPVFVLCAKDKLAADILKEYFKSSLLSRCDMDFTECVRVRLMQFMKWAELNPEKMKLPD